MVCKETHVKGKTLATWKPAGRDASRRDGRKETGWGRGPAARERERRGPPPTERAERGAPRRSAWARRGQNQRRGTHQAIRQRPEPGGEMSSVGFERPAGHRGQLSHSPRQTLKRPFPSSLLTLWGLSPAMVAAPEVLLSSSSPQTSAPPPIPVPPNLCTPHPCGK